MADERCICGHGRGAHETAGKEHDCEGIGAKGIFGERCGCRMYVPPLTPKFLRDYIAESHEDGDTTVDYIDDGGERKKLTMPTWLLDAMARQWAKRQAKGDTSMCSLKGSREDA